MASGMRTGLIRLGTGTMMAKSLGDVEAACLHTRPQQIASDKSTCQADAPSQIEELHQSNCMVASIPLLASAVGGSALGVVGSAEKMMSRLTAGEAIKVAGTAAATKSGSIGEVLAKTLPTMNSKKNGKIFYVSKGSNPATSTQYAVTGVKKTPKEIEVDYSWNQGSDSATNTVSKLKGYDFYTKEDRILNSTDLSSLVKDADAARLFQNPSVVKIGLVTLGDGKTLTGARLEQFAGTWRLVDMYKNIFPFSVVKELKFTLFQKIGQAE
jgi:hypothetical protein